MLTLAPVVSLSLCRFICYSLDQLSTLLDTYDTYIDPTEPDASHGLNDARSTSSGSTTVDVPSTPSMKKAKKAVATAEPSTPKILDKRHRLRSLPSLAAFLGFDFRLVVVLNTIGMLAVFVTVVWCKAERVPATERSFTLTCRRRESCPSASCVSRFVF